MYVLTHGLFLGIFRHDLHYLWMKYLCRTAFSRILERRYTIEVTIYDSMSHVIWNHYVLL